jgi:ABC-type multidrug transport system fused ATPase/permease subunit
MDTFAIGATDAEEHTLLPRRRKRKASEKQRNLKKTAALWSTFAFALIGWVIRLGLVALAIFGLIAFISSVRNIGGGGGTRTH